MATVRTVDRAPFRYGLVVLVLLGAALLALGLIPFNGVVVGVLIGLLVLGLLL